MSTKKRQTMAKMTRERKVKERRALKLEKKHGPAPEVVPENGTHPVADTVPTPAVE
jgi:hypothetical protein